MKKLILVITILLLVIVLGVREWLNRENDSTVERYIIVLNDLPGGYCPTVVKYAVTDPERNKIVVFDGQTAVQNCSRIELPLPAVSKNWNVYIGAPHALWAKVSFFGFGKQEISPIIGDLNGDNTINNLDERLVADQLFVVGQDLSLDLNQDRKIDSQDLTLVRLRFGVGEPHPDGKDWQTEVGI